MQIGVPAETTVGETRVAVTPETAKKLKAQGHTILVQSGAGVAASVTDAAYEAVIAGREGDVLEAYEQAQKALPDVNRRHIIIHCQTAREDQLDRIYKTTREKYDAAIQDIRACYERGQPVLVGTTSIENSEIIAQLLDKEKLPHQVLNAKQHAREADIVAQAGRAKMITIATNMAGRGTDIVLGGNVDKQVTAVGSLLDGDELKRVIRKRRRVAEMHIIDGALCAQDFEQGCTAALIAVQRRGQHALCIGHQSFFVQRKLPNTGLIARQGLLDFNLGAKLRFLLQQPCLCFAVLRGLKLTTIHA